MFGFEKSKKNMPEKTGGISEYARQLIDMLGCPCEHFPKGTRPSVIMSAYNKAFAEREMGGYTPVIIAVDVTLMEDVNEHCTTAEEFKANREKLLNSPRFDVRKWFTKQLSDLKSDMGDYWKKTAGEFMSEPGDALKSFSGFMDFGTPRRSEECILALIPTNEPWEVFAWLPFGGWNECPMPEEILWIAKYWYKRYGVIPAVMTHDILEFSARPIKDKNAALGVALEQYAFCQDIVDQGIGTIGRLAGGLMQSSVWYFWWD